MKIGNINNMMLFSFVSLVYMMFFAVGFSMKKKIKSTELSIFKGLIFSNMISLIVEILIVVFVLLESPFLAMTLKIFNVCLLVYIWIFGLYSFSTIKNGKDIDLNSISFILYLVFLISSCIIMLMLPVSINLVDYQQYSYGPSVKFLFFAAAIIVTGTIILLILNYKQLKAKKCTPILLFIFFIGLNAIIQYIWPPILLANTFFSFITFLMYFTIENPDIKMIKELTYSKEMQKRANDATMKSLNNLSLSISNSLGKLFIYGNKKIDKNNVDELIKETESIKKISVELVDQINGVIDLSKIESGKYDLEKANYNTYEMFDQIITLLNAKVNNKNIKITTDISNTIPKVLYGDAEKIKQTVIYLFNSILVNCDNPKINIKIFTLNVNMLCRLKISIIVDYNSIKEFLVVNPVNKQEHVDLKGLDYKIFEKLLELQKGSFDIIYNSETIEFTFSLDQRNVSYYQVEEKPKTKGKVKIFDASNKRILLVDDNRSKIKELIKMLEPYNVEIAFAHNYEEYNDLLYGNQTFDLILLDDMMPDSKKFEYLNYEQLQNNKVLEKIEKIAGYKISMVIMISPNELKLEEKYEKAKIDYIMKPVDDVSINKLLTKYFKKDDK